MKYSFIIGLALIVCLQQNTFAQNNASPYSNLGIGDLETNNFDRTSGMGHAGLALSSNRFLYNANPSSYSALDDKFFNVEISARYKGINYSGSPITSTSNFSSDLQFKKIIAAIKIKPKWGVAIGLLPFSTANYSFTGNKTVLGSSYTAPAYYEGTGSVNKLFFSNSVKITKNFSVGLESAILFGQLSEIESINTSLSDSLLVTTKKIHIGSPYFKPGFQYNLKVNNGLNLSVGGTVAFKANLKENYTLNAVDGSTTLLNNTSYKSTTFVLPAQYAGGIAAKIKDKFTIATDYSFQNWGNLNYKGLSYALVNSNHFGAGFEYAKKLTYRDVSFEKRFFQAGFFYNDSYLKIADQQINGYGITLGAGMNFLRSNLGLQASVELGTRGTTNSGLIKENYSQVNLTISYRDFWYVKVKKYD